MSYILKISLFLVVLALFCTSVFADDQKDPRINYNVTQENIDQTICVPNWTNTIRPSSSYTNALKKKQLPIGTDLSKVEEDHGLDLACGGHPTNPENLHPQPWPEARKKDKLEVRLHRDVCDRLITLKQCQTVFLGDWVSEYNRQILLKRIKP